MFFYFKTTADRGEVLVRVQKDSKNKFLHLKNCSIKRDGKIIPSYAIAESVFENGKNQKRIVKYLGALTAEQVESFRWTLKKLNEGSDKVVDFDHLQFSVQRNFLGVAVLHAIWERLGFSQVFAQSDRKKIPTAKVAEILTLSKLLKPSSNVRTVDWFYGTWLPEILNIEEEKYNRMKICNELTSIEESKPLIEHRLLQLSQSFQGTGFKIYFVDGTTTFFEGVDCTLGAPGKDKTTGFKSHMVLILLVTDGQGYPVAWDVCCGNKQETTEFKEIAKRICRDYKITHFTFCFDRGFASSSNFELIENLFTKFISGIDKDQITRVFDVNKFQDTKKYLLRRAQGQDVTPTGTLHPLPPERKRIFPIDGFYTSDSNRFYKELGVIGEYRYIAGFCTEIHEAEQTQRLRAQTAALMAIEEINQELRLAKKDRDLEVVANRVEKILHDKNMQKIITYTLVPTAVGNSKKPVQSCKIEVAVDAREWNAACMLDGLFIYVTDHTEKEKESFKLSAFDITFHYKQKYIIEQDFRDLKNTVNVRPLYVRLPEHVRAVVDICVLSQFINVYIGNKIKKIEMSISEFYELLHEASPVATMLTGARKLHKQIEVPERLQRALQELSLSDLNLSQYITANHH